MSTETQQQVQDTTQEHQEENTTSGGIKNILIALAIVGFAYYFYSTMTAYEQGEEVTMNRIFFLAYSLLGKNIVAIILGLLAVLMGYTGINELIAANKK